MRSKEKKNVWTNKKTFLNLFLMVIFYFRYHLKNITNFLSSPLRELLKITACFSHNNKHMPQISKRKSRMSINLLYVEGTIEKLQCILGFHKIRSTFYTKALYINFIKSFLLIDKFYCFWQGLHISFKGYLHYKTVFCNKVALDV